MGNPSAAHEPSMEEILASIRQIISEDGEQAEGEAEAPEGGDAPAMSEAGEAAPEMADAAQDEESSGEEAEQAEEASEPADDPTPMSAAAPAAAAAQPQPEPQQHRPEPTLRRQPAASQPGQPSAGAAQQPRPAAASGAAAMTSAVPASGAASAGDPRRLLSPQADASVSGAFSALAHTILAQNARTLEDLVSEMLRPMLKDWLDDNLPPLVERLVKEEIERVSRGRH